MRRKRDPATSPNPRSPLLEIKPLPLKSLVPYARNAKKHPREQLQKLKSLLAAYGWCRPVAIAYDTPGVPGILYGHGVTLAAIEMAEAGIPILGNEDPWVAPTVDLSHLKPAARRAYILADNRVSEDGEWDEEMLAIELGALKSDGFDLNLTAFDLPEIEQYLPSEFDGNEPSAGTADLLERMAITIAEPRHEVAPGDRYMLGERHFLLCVSPIDEWADWVPLLEGDALFCPYPGPFVPFGAKAAKHRLVMVQPDIYIAGHLLDRYADANGDDAVVKV